MPEKPEMSIKILPATVKPPTSEKSNLRVAAYCRVSTKTEMQMHSLEAQVDYYTNYISSKNNWTLVGIYADNCSGLKHIKRDGYDNLIKDCNEKMIDMILTKSVSRFGRDALEIIRITRRLKEMGIAVRFELENLDNTTIEQQRLIEIFAAAFQEESRQKSENIKFGIRERMKHGKACLNHTRFLGYTKDKDGKLVIVQKEAEIVRKIYELYLSGNGARKIKKYLEEHSIKTVTGKDKWSTATIMNILSNEKYMGKLIMQKYYTPNFLEGKQVRNRGEATSYIVENNHEAIIDGETWEMVRVLRERL